ncbi:MAG: ribonuclease Z [Planctomycetes bacterium]|nr:ribonuclease Z [Planctomycetota bacterium]
MGARWIVLGSGTAVPQPARGPAGHLLEAGGERVLFDAGSGTLERLARTGVAPDRIDRVFFSHYHPDHVMDLPTLLFALRHPAFDRARTLPVCGPPGLRAIAAGLEAMFGCWVKPERTRPRWDEIGPGWRAVLPFGTLETAESRHVPGSLAYRVTLADGVSLVYTGDTGYSAGLVDFARRADVLLSECSLAETAPEDLHLSPPLAGRMAREADVRSLVLCHFYPEVLATDIVAAVRREWAGPLRLAADLEAIALVRS